LSEAGRSQSPTRRPNIFNRPDERAACFSRHAALLWGLGGCLSAMGACRKAARRGARFDPRVARRVERAVGAGTTMSNPGRFARPVPRPRPAESRRRTQGSLTSTSRSRLSYDLAMAHWSRTLASLLPTAALLAGCGARIELAKELDSGADGSGSDATARTDGHADAATDPDAVGGDATGRASPDGPVVETVCDDLAQCCATLPIGEQAACASLVGEVDDCAKALEQYQQEGQCRSAPLVALAASCQVMDLCCLSVSSEDIAACGATVVANDAASCRAHFASMSVCAGYAAPKPTGCLTLSLCCAAPWLSAQDATMCNALGFAGEESACTPAIQKYCVVR
jgi:hypothetical protein